MIIEMQIGQLIVIKTPNGKVSVLVGETDTHVSTPAASVVFYADGSGDVLTKKASEQS